VNNLKELKPGKALNKAFLKVKPNRTEIEGFKTNLITLLDRTNDTESEEFHKNLVSDFLKETYYKQNHFINTKGRNDLVIHNGQNASTTVGVILEAKKPTNKAEMITTKKLNAKAFQELVLYYLRERITHKNIEVKHLVATNINEWFIFDATLFDRLFAQNKNLVKQFNDFEGGRLADTKTDFFYKQIAEPFIDSITSEIEFTYFNFQDYYLTHGLNPGQWAKDDNSLIALFKLLSPEHLLKLPFTNDSNSLDKRFYSELLHIIGLTETKEGSKKLIERNKAGERHTGTILEDTIIQLDSLDKLNRLEKPNQFGSTQQERLFNVALELSITWINRILFLKLLEAQLITYHKGDKTYSFLNLNKIKNYDDLNSLFFQVLARKHDERNEDVKKAFEKTPYLNSSLFEPTDIEQVTLFISNLKDDKTIPIFSQTVLKDQQGKKRTGNISTLQYLFEFLDAYDFGTEVGAAIQEDNKTLINASVLGLIFEKINGYKDGSFFTPGFITMYMCRETIRKAVVQKFNESKKWNCTTLEELYDKIEDRKEANKIVNSIKICDPAVGSGHFLVSALNEMIAVKNNLKILQDRSGKRLKEYEVEVVNDELIVTDEEGEFFKYNPSNKESQRIQETLFHEKQTIIENCLFGVDINSNSVKICRLRLWIELLKNAYYIKSSSPNLGEVSEGRRGQNQLNNLPHLKTFRKELRNNLTPAEAKLWTLLKGKQMQGRKFRRQHSVANYILDFYCPEERLAIELDGQGHFEATQAEYDKERDLFLETFGIKVVRFENKWVWDNPEGLLEEVRKCFGTTPAFQATPPYKEGELMELETLPNIDINIKCGNSLVSRFAIDANLAQGLNRGLKSKWNIDTYKIAVSTYRNAESKEQKREMERLIADIKSDFRSEISLNNPKVKKLRTLSGDLFQMTNQGQLFEMSKKEKADWNNKVQQLTEETKKLETEIEEIKANKIFENAFEWRFEFPEVLNDDGDFVGFDVVIGNPPYGVSIKDKTEREYLVSNLSKVPDFEIYYWFINKGHHILKQNGVISYIIPNTILFNVFAQSYRLSLFDNWTLNEILDCTNFNIFEDATVRNIIFQFTKSDSKKNTLDYKNTANIVSFESLVNRKPVRISKQTAESNIQNWGLVFKLDKDTLTIVEKIKSDKEILIELFPETSQGLIAYDKYQGQSAEIIKSRAYHHFSNPENKFKRWLYGEDITRYLVKWNGKEYIDYCDGIANPREPKFFNGKRLLIREITNPRIFAAITLEELYNDPAIIIVKECSDSFSLECLAAIFNSKLATFYHFNSSPKATKGAFPKILVYDVNNFPLPKKIDSRIQKRMETLVEQILTTKAKDNSADITDLESQIDQLVYQLYGLTEEEIKIIENALLNINRFNGFKLYRIAYATFIQQNMDTCHLGNQRKNTIDSYNG
jgi:very-short-patch-repair endonuclease